MVVKVTAKHIRKGIRLSICDCPIALALKEQLHKIVEVDDIFIAYHTYGPAQGKRWSKTPSPVRSFMIKFDHCKPVKPFSFEASFTRSCYYSPILRY